MKQIKRTPREGVFFRGQIRLVWGAALFPLLPDLRDRHTADAPVVRVHFIDGHHRGGLVLAQHIMEQIRRPFDEPALLLRRDLAFLRDFNIDVRYGDLLSFVLL